MRACRNREHVEAPDEYSANWKNLCLMSGGIRTLSLDEQGGLRACREWRRLGFAIRESEDEMLNERSILNSCRAWPYVLSAAAGLATMCQSAEAGTWTKIVNNPPGAVNLMILLSDGTVMCANNNGSTIGKAWYKLTPSSSGSYVNGSWSTLAS